MIYQKSIKRVKIQQELAQEFLKRIKSLFRNVKLIDTKYKIMYDKNYVLFPLTENETIVENLKAFKKELPYFSIIEGEATLNENYKPRNTLEILAEFFSEKELRFVPKSYDIIGNVAIVEFTELNHSEIINKGPIKVAVAKSLKTINSSLESVYEKVGEIKGRYRLRNLKLLYGPPIRETIHKENGCQFILDIKDTYFSPRLVNERREIASQDFSEQELIVDMFAGVGPFSIEIAKKHNVIIYSFDINPKAYSYLVKNVSLNRVGNKVHPHQYDVKKILTNNDNLSINLHHKAKRIIMNLPESSLDYIDVACYLMDEKGAIIHNYQFCSKPEPIRKGMEKLESQLVKYGFNVERILNKRIVKPFSPKKDLVSLNVRVKK